jgi:hypothetical protein
MKKGNEHMTDKASVPAIERYRLATIEWRQAYAQLAAADIRAGRVGFGIPVDIVSLRHSIANPDEAGSLGDDIRKLLA